MLRGRIEQRDDLGFGQLLSSHHSCLPCIPEAGRPADLGEEVDQGGAPEAEGAADNRLAVCRCIGSDERPAKPNRDGFPAQGTRPIPLARPPEFVVCPLMREIRVFRYFWPWDRQVLLARFRAWSEGKETA